MIDILNVKPTEITKGIGNLTTMLFAAPKAGKSTFCANSPRTLIIDTEKGYGCISGATVITVKTFAEVKMIVNQLKKKEAKAAYDTVAIDVIDQLGSMCEKYVISSNNINSMSDLGHGRAWDIYKKELTNILRGITMEGYGLILTSHVKQEIVKPVEKEEYTILRASPTPSLYKIASAMCDIIAYGYTDPITHERYLRLRCNDSSVEVGSRFAYTKEIIPFSYQSLVNEVNRAIEEEEKHGGVVSKTGIEIANDLPSYEELMTKGNNIVKALFEKDANLMTKVNMIVEDTLGTGSKFSECGPRQVESMAVIVSQLEELYNTSA